MNLVDIINQIAICLNGNIIMPKLLKKIVIVASIILTLVGSLTFVMTYQNIGFGESFLLQWLSSLLLAATIMAPTGFIMMTLVSRTIKRLLPHTAEMKRNFATGFTMAIIMESIMALVTTLNNLGISNTAEFMQNWWGAFTLALPLGLVIALMMTVFVKPKLEKFMAS